MRPYRNTSNRLTTGQSTTKWQRICIDTNHHEDTTALSKSGASNFAALVGGAPDGAAIFVQDSLMPASPPSVAASVDSSEDLIMSWPASATNYALQTSPVLG